MYTKRHKLVQQSVGTQREIVSLHYGTGKKDKKVYLQAGLHADEVPSMLVLHHLRELLDQAEAEGLISGEIVIVPCANPIGLSQHLMRDHLGRFDFNSGQNFNRAYPDFYLLVKDRLDGLLGSDEKENKHIVRNEIKKALKALECDSELDSMRLALLQLSYDADWVLDMHCDFEALMHVYTDTPYLDQVDGLARFLGAETLLHAEGSGGSAFDESQSGVWYRLKENYSGSFPIPLAGCGVTIEYRGESDVNHTLAMKDAAKLFDWLKFEQLISEHAPELPKALCIATPLAGCESIISPCSGVLVYVRELGEEVEAGDVIAEIISPVDRSVTKVRATVAGKFFARENRRFAISGMSIGKVAGVEAYRTGALLGA